MLSTLAELGPALAAGSTTVLGLGALAMRLQRGRPLAVKRLGELTLLAGAVWFVGALLPLPRWQLVPDLSLSLAGTGAGPAADLAAAEHGRTGGSAAAPRIALDSSRTGAGPAGAESEDAAGGGRPARRAAPGGHDRAGPGLGSGRTAEPIDSTPATLAARPADAAITASNAGRSADPAPRGSADIPAGPPAPPAPADEQRPAEAASSAHHPGDGSSPAGPPWPSGVGEGLALLFLVGAGFHGLRLALGWIRLRRVLASTCPAPPRLARLAAALDGADLDVRVHAGPTGPFCVGLRRPVIVLPASLVDADRPRTLAHVLAHEIAHARHGDGLGRLLVALTLPAFWCHPLFWWIRRDLRLAGELLADDRAALQSDRRHYARDLLDLASTDLAAGAVPAGAPSIFGTPSEFTRRIDMLLQRSHPLATRLSTRQRALHGLGTLAVTALALMTFGAPPAVAQNSDAQREVSELRVRNAALETQLADLRSMIQRLEDRLAVTSAQADAAREQQGLIGQLLQDRDDQADVTSAELDQLAELGYLTGRGSARGGGRAAGRNHTVLGLGGGQGGAGVRERLHDELATTEAALASLDATQADVRTRLAELESRDGADPAERQRLHESLDVARAAADTQRARRQELRDMLVAADSQGGGAGRALGGGLIAGFGGNDQGRTDAEPEDVALFSASGRVRAGGAASAHDPALFASGGQGGVSRRPGAVSVLAGSEQVAAQDHEPSDDPVRSGVMRSAANSHADSSRLLMDDGLLGMIDRLLESQSTMGQLQRRLEENGPLFEQGFLSSADIESDRADLELAERRFRVMRTLLEGELRACEVEISQVVEHEPLDRARLMRLEARMEVIRSVL